jgi:hypothetical protein
MSSDTEPDWDGGRQWRGGCLFSPPRQDGVHERYGGGWRGDVLFPRDDISYYEGAGFGHGSFRDWKYVIE